METDESKKGYIRVSHLVYIIIIAVIVLAFFLVFTLGDSETAGTTIGTASTVSSLILSVIAIVMTLIDVAGQRQSMFDLKETADKLKVSNESAGALFLELKTEIVDLQNTKQQMLEAVVESDEWRKQLITILGKLESVKNSGFQTEDLEKIINEVQQKKLEMLERKDTMTNINLIRDLPRDYIENRISPSFPRVLSFLRTKFKKGDKITLVDFRVTLHKEYNISLTLIEQIENDLAANGKIIKVLDSPGYIELTF